MHFIPIAGFRPPFDSSIFIASPQVLRSLFSFPTVLAADAAAIATTAVALLVFLAGQRRARTSARETSPLQPWQELARELLAQSHQIVVFIDAEMRVLFASDWLLSLTGYIGDDVIGRSWLDLLVAAEDRDATARNLVESPAAFTSEIVGRNGAQRRIRWRAVSLSADGSSVTALIGEDLTEREEKLRQKRRGAFYERVLDGIISCVFVANPAGRVIYVNAALRDRSGIVDSEIGEETDDGQPLSPSLAAFRPVYEEARRAGGPRRFRGVTVTRANGQERVHDGWMIPLFEGGELTGVMCTSEDVTELHAAEAELRDFEQRLRTLIDSVPGIVWVADDGGRVRFVSRRAETLLGYSASEWMQPNFFFDHLHADDRPRLAEASAELLDTGHGRELDFRMIAADGRVVWLHGSASVFHEEGRAWMHGVSFDVTDVHLAQDALRRSTALLRGMFEQSALGITIADEAGQILDRNAAFLAMCGACGPDGCTRLPGEIAAMRSQNGASIDREVDCGNGVWRRVRASHVIAHEGEQPVIVTVIEDVSERKRAEKELRGSRDTLAEFVSLTTDWVWECDAEARYTYASGRVRDVLGYEPHEVIGKTACDLTPPNEIERTKATLLKLLECPQSFSHLEVTGQHRDGHYVHLEVSGAPLLDANGRLAGYRGVVRDVTEREEARRERQRLAMAIEHAGDMVVITDRKGVIEYVNPAFEAVTGYGRDEARGRTPSIVRSGQQNAQFYDDLWRDLDEGRVWAGRFVNRRRDGRLYNADATISPIFDDHRAITGYVSVQRDVTETLALIERLRTASELERFGRLVGGVAHEVRNPLNAIQAAAAALELDFGDDPDARPLFEVVRAQVGRLAQLMRDLLVIGRPIGELALQPRSMRELVIESLELWAAAHPHAMAARVKVSIDCNCDVRADALRLHQVILNVLDNAFEHSPADGEIAVGLERAARHCRLTVRDCGPGVKRENLERVFEPFFTTRRAGTGLGLTLVRSIVEQHGGTVRLTNNDPPPGCTVAILLPALNPGGSGCSQDS